MQVRRIQREAKHFSLPPMTRYLRERTWFGPLIEAAPSPRLGLVVAIPAKDEEGLIGTLEALRACDSPESHAEVIVVVNSSESDSPETVRRNAEIAAEATSWARRNSSPNLGIFVLHHPDLPKKHAGVGLARKIGLDEGCRRLEAVGNPRGALACFDADSRCDRNYLAEIEALFQRDRACQACSIYFEHPTEGAEFSPEIYDAIAGYELHLRYYIHAQRWAGFPHAIQTIGSSMAVRSDAYQAQNGMNKRKAGEDFYFLHKFTPLGGVRELTSTRVIPSPRPSHRVPFGTGKAVGKLLENGLPCQTYHPRSFQDLRVFLGSVDRLFDLPDDRRAEFLAGLPKSIRSYLETQPIWERIGEIRANTTNLERFRARFFRWFDAFAVMKFLHHARERFHADCDVEEAARWLLDEESGDVRQLLARFREMDRR